MKYLIIGGSAGGASTAARIRRNDEKAEIVIIEKGKYISYANCGLPYYIGGIIEERDKLFVQTPETFKKRFNVDIRPDNEAVKIDRENKVVIIRSNNGEEYQESYDKLILSPGASALRPPLPGIDLEGVFTIRDIPDTDAIKAFIDSKQCMSAVIVGAGFIGLEMAENLHHAGVKVSVVEMTNQVMPPIDFSMASIVHKQLMSKGVNLYLGEMVTAIEKKGDRLVVKFKSGEYVNTDMVIMSIGVRPNSKIAIDAGLEEGQRGALKVNEYLQTSDENIYAVGDVIEYPHPITGIPWCNFLGGPANRQGRIVADNLVYGNKVKYEGSIGTSIARVFDLTVGATGMAEKQLKQDQYPFYTSTTHSASHATYFPNAKGLTIKLTYSQKTGQLYGCQIVGFEGVDKRIDQAAIIIKKKGTIYDLIELEHAYAPPYSSAKDPLIIAGYVAENVMKEKVKMVYWKNLDQLDTDAITLLDVRTDVEHTVGTIKGAINIPLDDLRNRLHELPKDKPIYTFCQIGLRGYLAYRILEQNGFDVYNISGGYKTFSTATAPIELCRSNDDIDEYKVHKHGEPIDTSSEGLTSNMVKVNACGLQCPGPLMKMKQSVDDLDVGAKVEIRATDQGFVRDAQAWCNSTGNTYISDSEKDGVFTVIIEKGKPKDDKRQTGGRVGNDNKTFIMFSDELDKALATFVLANGAAATGKKVTIFFTFWGLNVIKKVQKPSVKKDFFGKMFSMMLPSNSKRLKLSKFNMFGAGSAMMRNIMKTKNIDSLESLMQQAMNNGVEFIACQMSMDVMGVKREELLDNVTVGGVATYINKADDANINLFI